MTRRLLLVADSRNGGLGEIAVSHARWFASRGWTVTLAAAHENDVEGVRCAPLRLPATVADTSGMRRAVDDIAFLLRSTRPDVVHCHGLRCFLATRIAGAPAFLTVHGAGVEHPGRTWAARRLRRALARIAAAAARELFVVAPGLTAKGRFLPHASPRLAGLDVIPWAAPADPTFLWIGRLEAPKRPDVFIDAIATASQTKPVVGVVAGSGPLEAAMRERARAAGALIQFLGHSDDLRPVLARTHAVVLASESEGLPLALQEAMWTGRSVVVSDLPGPRWLVGDTGVLATTTAGFAHAVVNLSDHRLARRLGDAAAQRVRTLIAPHDPWRTVEQQYLQGDVASRG